MIDSHCHLEQRDFDADRDEIIEKCKKELKAVITCCAHPSDFDLTIKMTNKYKNFVFATFGIHPEFIKEIREKEKDKFMGRIKENKSSIVGIGECGLDYFWVKDETLREKQKELFIEFINLAKDLKLPLVIHARDAVEDAIKILEKCDARNVQMHMFGSKNLLQRVIENGWRISIGPIIKTSKAHRKIARDMPIENILLETDSPWFGFGKRNDPLSIKLVAEKIAEIRKLDFEKVWKTCGENAARFFGLPVKI